MPSHKISLKIRFNIILPRTYSSPRLSFSFRFPLPKNPACIYRVPNACYMSQPSLPRCSAHPSNICWGVQSIKRLIIKFFPSSLYFTLHYYAKYLPVADLSSSFTAKVLIQCSYTFTPPYTLMACTVPELPFTFTPTLPVSLLTYGNL